MYYFRQKKYSSWKSIIRLAYFSCYKVYFAKKIKFERSIKTKLHYEISSIKDYKKSEMPENEKFWCSLYFSFFLFLTYFMLEKLLRYFSFSLFSFSERHFYTHTHDVDFYDHDLSSVYCDYFIISRSYKDSPFI